jgi:hypothetical protein
MASSAAFRNKLRVAKPAFTAVPIVRITQASPRNWLVPAHVSAQTRQASFPA